MNKDLTDKEYIFCTKGLSVGYQGIPLIRDITLQVKQGEILTLIGPNGAGKTTILKSLINQLRPISGCVVLKQQEIQSMNPTLLSQKMSIVLTEKIHPEMMTCEDVVATGRYPYTGRFGILNDHDRNVIKDSMELVHITELSGKNFLQISDGQKQRVMLARALAQEPDILVLDEPTSFLDIRYKLEFLSILQTMAREKNLTVIMSLHELDFARRISDKIACIKGDCIHRFGSPEEIFSGNYITELFGITTGSYDGLSGSPELSKVSGSPTCFVFAGGGTGTPLFHKLQRQGIPFAAGILWENDLDYPCAKALATEVISIPAFQELTPKQIKQAEDLIDQCENVYCTLTKEMLEHLPEPLLKLIQNSSSTE